MASIGIQNFIRGFGAAAAGYQRGKLMADQFRLQQAEQEAERALRQQVIQNQLLQSNRAYDLQRSQFDYMKENDAASRAATESRNRLLDKRYDEDRKARMNKEYAEFTEKEAFLYERGPEAYSPLIRARYQGLPDPEITSPPIRTGFKGIAPGAVPGLPGGLPGVGVTLPGAAGEEALRRNRGRLKSDTEREDKRRKFEAEQRTVREAEIDRDLNRDILRTRLETEQGYRDQAREDRERAVVERDKKVLENKIAEARKDAVTNQDPQLLVDAIRRHDEFVSRYPKYNFPKEGDVSGYRFAPGTTYSEGQVEVPYPTLAGGVVFPKIGIRIPGTETPEEVNARNLEIAGKELKLERAAALKSVEGMQKFLASEAFRRLPLADQNRALDLFWENQSKGGLIPSFPRGSKLEMYTPEQRLRLEDKRLDRKLNYARLNHQKNVQTWREGIQKAKDLASGGDKKGLNESLITLREIYRQSMITWRQLRNEGAKTGKFDTDSIQRAETIANEAKAKMDEVRTMMTSPSAPVDADFNRRFQAQLNKDLTRAQSLNGGKPLTVDQQRAIEDTLRARMVK